MTAYNLLTFTYNANGDLTGKTNTLTSATTSYTYDVFGNLTSVTLPSTDVITYEIDGLNRRIGKRINGTLQARWVYMDQTRIAAELDASGNIAKRFVYASKGNIPDYMIMGGDNYRIISDQLGSPRLVVKVSDGSIAERMDHDEFGRVIADTNPGLLPFGFAGGLYDVDTGLVRFGTRDFDSETGRWTAKDSILFSGGDTNLFAYTFQDPVNLIDSDGRCPVCIAVAVGATLLYTSSTDTVGQAQTEKGIVKNIILAALGAFRGAQVENTSGRFNPNQEAVVDLAKQAKRTGVSQQEAETLVEWANEYNVPGRNVIDPPHNYPVNFPHGHIGPVNHIPICK